VLFGFFPAVRDMAKLWLDRADYSHGLLLVPFAAYLLWHRAFPAVTRWPDPWAVPFFAVAVLLFVLGKQTNFLKEWAQGFALVFALAGVAVAFCGGWKGLAWAWPGLAVLPLGFQLPHQVESTLSFQLREVATSGSCYALQTLGYPAYTTGNVIAIEDTRLGVEAACSGLSMLLTFVAVSAAVALLLPHRPWIDRVGIVFAAVPIAVACNLVRVVFTGLIYHAGWKQLGDLIVHDLFGWLMMPLALGLVWAGLKILDWVVVTKYQATKQAVIGATLQRAAVKAAIAQEFRRPVNPPAGP
jgi:exosortase